MERKKKGEGEWQVMLWQKQKKSHVSQAGNVCDFSVSAKLHVPFLFYPPPLSLQPFRQSKFPRSESKYVGRLIAVFILRSKPNISKLSTQRATEKEKGKEAQLRIVVHKPILTGFKCWCCRRLKQQYFVI